MGHANPSEESPTSVGAPPIGRVLDQLAAADPEAPAVIFNGFALARRDLATRTNRLACAYRQRGVQPGSLVTIGLSNGVGFIEATIAAWKVGATPQPVSSRLPAAERDKILALAQPSLVIGVDPVDTTFPTLSLDDAALADLPDDPFTAPTAKSWKAPTSGGSTGLPKLILDTRPATAATTDAIASLLRISAADTVLITGPLYHNAVFITMAASIASGAPVVLMPRFDAANTLRLIERHSVTWMYAVPTMMHRIWRLPDAERLGPDLSTLRTVYHLGAPCPPWLKHEWIHWLGPDVVWELYAGTEAQAATVISGREWLSHEGSVGRPVSGQMRVLGLDGDDLPPGQIGEVWMRPDGDVLPPYVYIGSTARERDGWQSLGDLGRFDDDGYLYLADRESDMILSGGANIYPAEVEAALDEHPTVLSCCVIGLPSDDLGNSVHALVQLAEPVDDAALDAFLAKRIVRYKIPRSYERVEYPLRDDAGKVRRGALRGERLASGASG